MKLNNSDTYESLTVSLTPDKTPIAYEQRVQSLIESGLERSEAETMALEPIELELYYDVNAGLFAVESEAVEAGTIYNPYTNEQLEE